MKYVYIICNCFLFHYIFLRYAYKYSVRILDKMKESPGCKLLPCWILITKKT